MPAPRLPPLNSLRAFEVAARLLSFKKAADELNVTPTAVSHRIRVLEDWLDLRLFNRLTRALELTKEGEAYAKRVHAGFEELIAASDSLRQSVDGGELSVSATMSFASHWLAPRIPQFHESQDDIVVRLEATDDLRDLTRTNIDLSIRFGEGGYDDLYSEMLFTDHATVVCLPALADRLRCANDLRQAPLIAYRWQGHGEGDPDWRAWFDAAGSQGGDVAPTSVMSDEHLAIQQVLAGGGAALVGITAVAPAILDGRLVRPFPVALEDHSHYFTCRPDMLLRPKVLGFRDWIRDQAIAFEETIAGDPRLAFQTVRPRSVP